MNKSVLFWLLLLLLLLILGWWLCRKYICGISAAAPIGVVDDCDSSLRIADGNTFDLNADRNIRFLKSSFNSITNNNQLTDVINKTADYLKNNSARGLVVTGRYDDDESNRSVLPNLGLARANSVKKLLTDLGAPSNQIEINAALDTSACYKKDTLTNGIAFGFNALSGSNDRLDKIKARLFGKPLTVYFATDSDELNFSTQQRQDIADLIYYLDNVSGSNLEISGHTDNVGNRAYNMNLSKERAEFVRTYLSKNGGINSSMMNAAGFGPDKPITTNSNSAGRQKNRRVEVTLQ